jgi:hypothetical protein
LKPAPESFRIAKPAGHFQSGRRRRCADGRFLACLCVPLVRVAVGDLTNRMTEFVVLHVPMHHRQEPYFANASVKALGAEVSKWPATRFRSASWVSVR